MSIVFLALGGAFAAFAFHVGLWRVYLPRRAMRVLLGIFLAGLAGVLVAGWTWVPAFGWGEGAYVSVLYGSVALCYFLTYTGIECDSPTLSLVQFIAQSGTIGRSSSEFKAFIQGRPFVKTRLAQLEEGGFVIRRGKYLELAGNSTLVLDAGEFYRRLMGRTTFGG